MRAVIVAVADLVPKTCAALIAVSCVHTNWWAFSALLLGDSAVFKSQEPRFMQPIERTAAVIEKEGRELAPCTYGSSWCDVTTAHLLHLSSVQDASHCVSRRASAIDRLVLPWTGTKSRTLRGMYKHRFLARVAQEAQSY